MKIIDSKIHGILDYVVVVFLLLSPTIFPLSGFVSTFTYVLGFVHLTLTLITNFPMGVLRVLPFKIHGLIEMVVSFALVAFCFVFNLEGADFYFYIAFGAAVFITWTLTKYE